jgi:hypothetical protein
MRYLLVLYLRKFGLPRLGDASCNSCVINEQANDMKQSKTTYTKRVNARRAGVAAGIPRERITITVHKNGDEVRFGWRESESTAKQEPPAASKAAKTPKVNPEERNGVKRPKVGGVCAAVWAWLDMNPAAALKEAKAAAPAHGWNENNVSCEFYARRKFLGITGRAVAA